MEIGSNKMSDRREQREMHKATCGDCGKECEAQDLVEEEAQDLTEDHDKCTKQPAETAVMNVKFHLNQNRTSQYIVRTASRNIKLAKNILE